MNELTSNLDSKFLSKAKSAGSAESNPKKFGTFLGVFVPSILMLFGVIIFLRLGWVVGVAGLPTTLSIITLASLITLITVISMSAIATNIQVKAGGVYYILSRSLGIEVGSAIGIPLFLRQSLTIAFCIIGFAESVKDLMPSWDITYIGLATLAVLAAIAYTSVRGAMKVQMAILIAIVAALASLFTGHEVQPMQPDSYVPGSLSALSFWAVFAIFFPAMTGVESSVSMSGDLKNPSKSLPLGTISTIVVGFLIYAAVAIFLSIRVPAERLVEDPLIIQDLASIPALIVVGIWGATLSSALGGMLAAPRTLKAIADDGIAPKVFSKTFGPMEEPRVATLVTCAITLFGICYGSINIIAPLLTMISLICYGVLNLSCGIETLISNPSWRPRVSVHWSVSMLGAILCLIAMLMIAPGYALMALSLMGLIYFVVAKKGHKSPWSDIKQGILFYFSRNLIYRLAFGNGVRKSWRPHFLIFSKFDEQQSAPLLNFSESISQGKGFLTLATFIQRGELSIPQQRERQKEIANGLKNQNIQAFVRVNESESSTLGMRQMVEHYGFGPLQPNTILLGGIKKEDETAEFVSFMQLAYERHYNIVIMNECRGQALNPPLSNPPLSNPPLCGEGEIHLWWDNLRSDNSELMLVLAFMLQRNSKCKKRRISLKVTVENEIVRRHKLEEFQRLCLEKRLPVEVEVYVVSEKETLELAQSVSKEAERVFMGLATPPKGAEETEAYIHYLHDLSEFMKHSPKWVFVLSSEHIPLESILQ